MVHGVGDMAPVLIMMVAGLGLTDIRVKKIKISFIVLSSWKGIRFRQLYVNQQFEFGC